MKKEIHKIGDIILVPFPFTDLSDNKLRPSIVIGLDRNDINFVFITSVKPDGLFLNIEQDKINNLKTKSYIRYSKIATLDKNICLVKLGTLSAKGLTSLKKEIFNYLM